MKHIYIHSYSKIMWKNAPIIIAIHLFYIRHSGENGVVYISYIIILNIGILQACGHVRRVRVPLPPKPKGVCYLIIIFVVNALDMLSLFYFNKITHVNQ